MHQLREGLRLGMTRKRGSAVRLWGKRKNGEFYEPFGRIHEQYGDTPASKRNEGSQLNMWGIRAPTRISDISISLQVLPT